MKKTRFSEEQIIAVLREAESGTIPSAEADNPPAEKTQNGINRRKFLGQAGAAAAAVALASPPATFAQSVSSRYTAGPSDSVANARVVQSFETRVAAATREALVPVPPHTTNGDETRYPDKSGSYTKGLLQDGYGKV